MIPKGRDSGRNPVAAGAGNALLARMRHELRTPLNAIIGYSEMLLEDAGNCRPAVIADLTRVHESGLRLVSLVNDVLSPAKIEAGMPDPDLDEIGAALRNRLRGPLDDVIACSDRLLEGADLTSLSDRAGDLERIGAAGQRLRALMEDPVRLAGLEAEHDAAGSPIVSGPDKGAISPLSPPPQEDPQGSDAGSGWLLVVDDNENNRDILSRFLERRGHQVAAAAGGHEALAMLASRPFDLILLDVMMPEMDGFQLLQRLKADGKLKEIPVIFISALDDTSGKVKAFRTGGVDYVTKPFQPEEVIARVENQLKISRLQRDLALQNRELSRKNEELVQAQKRTDRVFSALAEVLPGSVLDETYRVEEMIGTGGFGAVYRGTHLGLCLPVAIKVFRPITGNDTPDALERFRQEGIAASRVKHPNAVEILDSGISAAGIAFLVMELLKGHTLGAELREKGALTAERTAAIIVPICEALAEVHAAGIVHRDIKPENIYLHQGSKGEVAKLLDFGVSKMLWAAADQTLEASTTTQSFIGTPAYMAPERLMGRPYDGRSDVYSLGITMFCMLNGKPPFHAEEGSGFALAMMHLTRQPPSLREQNPDLPAGLDSLVQLTLSRDPELRPTAKKLAELITAMGPFEP